MDSHFLKLNFSDERLIQWWSILNAKKRPKDMPKGYNDTEVFLWLMKRFRIGVRLAFWNGDFEQGLNAEKYL